MASTTRGDGLVRAGRSILPPASIRSSSVNRSQRGISGGGSVMFRSYCSKRLSVRISITSRKPAVVTSAVRAPRRSISALVARVVPWMIVPISAHGDAGLRHHLRQHRQDGAFRRGIVGEDLGRNQPAADFERDIGERATDVDAEPCGRAARNHCVSRQAAPGRWRDARRRAGPGSTGSRPAARGRSCLPAAAPAEWATAAGRRAGSAPARAARTD